jgi:hypothetical protein
MNWYCIGAGKRRRIRVYADTSVNVNMGRPCGRRGAEKRWRRRTGPNSGFGRPSTNRISERHARAGESMSTPRGVRG